MDKLPSEEFSPRITVDAGVNLSELTKENVEKIELLAPFGQENKIPRFWLILLRLPTAER